MFWFVWFLHLGVSSSATVLEVFQFESFNHIHMGFHLLLLINTFFGVFCISFDFHMGFHLGLIIGCVLVFCIIYCSSRVLKLEVSFQFCSFEGFQFFICWFCLEFIWGFLHQLLSMRFYFLGFTQLWIWFAAFICWCFHRFLHQVPLVLVAGVHWVYGVSSCGDFIVGLHLINLEFISGVYFWITYLDLLSLDFYISGYFQVIERLFVIDCVQILFSVFSERKGMLLWSFHSVQWKWSITDDCLRL